MRIKIVSVGKIKEDYLQGGVAEYARRLRPYVNLELVSVRDEPIPDQPAEAEEAAVVAREGERLRHQVRDGTYLVALDQGGTALTSEELAGLLDRLALAGRSDLTFVIGGTLGLDRQLLARADLTLSLSRLTFPHQMVPLLLLEQLYRAVKISRGEPYHR